MLFLILVFLEQIGHWQVDNAKMLECQSRFFFLREPLNFHFLWELKMLLGCLLVVVAKRDQQDLVIFLIAFK